MKNEIKGFTLAETMIVIIVLGIIATLTIPALVNKQKEAVARTKVRKAMSAYDLAIQKMTIENDLKSDTALISWAGNQENNCINSTQYFKKSQDINGCTFKTSDGLWWNISDITHPVISLKKIDENTEGQTLDDIKTKADNQNDLTAFYLVTTYNPETGAFRTDDLAFEEQRDNTSADYLRVKKLYMLTKGIKSNSNSDTPTVDACHTGVQKYISDYGEIIEDTYDNKGNIVSQKRYNGETLRKEYTYSYENNGNVIENSCEYAPYYPNGMVCSQWTNEYKNGKLVSSKQYDANNNLSYETLYTYENGNETIANCDYAYAHNCVYTYKEYNSKGNLTKEDYSSIRGQIYYYAYDDNGNITSSTIYDTSGNLKGEDNYTYENGKVIHNSCSYASYYTNGISCNSYTYEYDDCGRIKKYSSEGTEYSIE